LNTGLILLAIVMFITFGIAATVGPDPMTFPTAAQNMTGDNATVMGGGVDNVTAGNITVSNWTK
jgi:hypothetical protein